MRLEYMAPESIEKEKIIDEVSELIKLPKVVLETDKIHGKKINIPHSKTCSCKINHLNCMTAKEWMKSQIGVWEFNYEKKGQCV
jgi:hypothetical protein